MKVHSSDQRALKGWPFNARLPLECPEATPVAKINNIEKSDMIGYLTIVFLWFLSLYQWGKPL